MLKKFFVVVMVLFSTGSLALSEDVQGVRKFTSEEAKERLAQIDASLKEYRAFFDLVLSHSSLPEDQQLAFYRSKLKPGQHLSSNLSTDEIKEIASLDWSTQNIGFSNWTTYVNGYCLQLEIELLKKDLEIKKLKREKGQDELKNEINRLEMIFSEKYAKESNFID